MALEDLSTQKRKIIKNFEYIIIVKKQTETLRLSAFVAK
jgi:hypothetical protein